MTAVESNGWCPVCGARGACPHCHWCTRTREQGHAEFCPDALETWPSPIDNAVCHRCERPLSAFRLVPANPPRDRGGNEVWDMVCPMCAMVSEGGD